MIMTRSLEFGLLKSSTSFFRSVLFRQAWAKGRPITKPRCNTKICPSPPLANVPQDQRYGAGFQAPRSLLSQSQRLSSCKDRKVRYSTFAGLRLPGIQHAQNGRTMVQTYKGQVIEKSIIRNRSAANSTRLIGRLFKSLCDNASDYASCSASHVFISAHPILISASHVLTAPEHEYLALHQHH